MIYLNEVQEVTEIPSSKNTLQSKNQNPKTDAHRNDNYKSQQSSYIMQEYPAAGDDIENSVYISIAGILLLVVTLFYSLRRAKI